MVLNILPILVGAWEYVPAVILSRSDTRYPSQDSVVFQQNLVIHQPHKRIAFDPIPEQFRASVLGRDFRKLESRDSCHQGRTVDPLLTRMIGEPKPLVF